MSGRCRSPARRGRSPLEVGGACCWSPPSAWSTSGRPPWNAKRRCTWRPSELVCAVATRWACWVRAVSVRRRWRPVWGRCSPFCGAPTGWSRWMRTPRSAGWAAGSTRAPPVPTGTWPATRICSRSPTSARGSAPTRPACTCWPENRPRAGAGCSTRRCTGRRRCAWTGISPSRSSTAGRPWTPR